MKIFLISPVRRISKKERELIKKYVEKLEKEGHQVYWPIRDTNQADPIGLRICKDNRKAIKEANEIHIWWSENSRGSLFDFGMAFMAQLFMPEKKFVLVNEVKTTPEKSFSNVLFIICIIKGKEK